MFIGFFSFLFLLGSRGRKARDPRFGVRWLKGVLGKTWLAELGCKLSRVVEFPLISLSRHTHWLSYLLRSAITQSCRCFKNDTWFVASYTGCRGRRILARNIYMALYRHLVETVMPLVSCNVCSRCLKSIPFKAPFNLKEVQFRRFALMSSLLITHAFVHPPHLAERARKRRADPRW